MLICFNPSGDLDLSGSFSVNANHNTCILLFQSFWWFGFVWKWYWWCWQCFGYKVSILLVIWICLEAPKLPKTKWRRTSFNPSGDLDLSGRVWLIAVLIGSIFVSILLVIWICLEENIYVCKAHKNTRFQSFWWFGFVWKMKSPKLPPNIRVFVSILLVIWICLEAVLHRNILQGC